MNSRHHWKVLANDALELDKEQHQIKKHPLLPKALGTAIEDALDLV
jgi:hypothetical protein